jgi:hypothetical protein
MAVEEAPTVEAGSTAAEDFMAGAPSTGAAGFAAPAASGAERASAAAAGFVATRSAEERLFAEGQAFAVERSGAAFAVTASAAAGTFADAAGVGASAGAGRIGVGPDTRIRTVITTRGGRLRITRPAMIPTTILMTTTTLRPAILRLPTRTEMIPTGTTDE